MIYGHVNSSGEVRGGKEVVTLSPRTRCCASLEVPLGPGLWLWTFPLSRVGRQSLLREWMKPAASLQVLSMH